MRLLITSIALFLFSSCMYSIHCFEDGNESSSLLNTFKSIIPSNERYYAVIEQAVFEIQGMNDFDFVLPAYAEFVFIGTIGQAYKWERESRRIYTLFPYGVTAFYDTYNQWVVVIDLFDDDGALINSVMHWTPYHHLNPMTDNVRFIGSWNDIQYYKIVDIDSLHIELRAHMSLNDVYHVRFFSTTNSGSWPIQCSANWDFVPPTYINVEISDVIEYNGRQLVLITFYLYDVSNEKKGYHIVKFPINHYCICCDYSIQSPKIPIFTRSYIIGTFYELGGF